LSALLSLRKQTSRRHFLCCQYGTRSCFPTRFCPLQYILKISVFAGAAALLSAIGIGGAAFAHGKGGMCGMRGEYMKKMATAHIDEAMDYAKVEGPSRDKIHEIRDRLFTEFEKNKPDREAKFKEIAELFQADTLDTAKVAALRAEHQARMQSMGDVVEQAFIEAHDTLTPAQRKAIVEYAQKNRPRHWQE
jgi:Spy/CpxP family protein refolding chaperone